ncbi:16S rRNA (cytidine(1402)-2'-O)-methyltransferase [Tistlia consotensis]|uniref:16S rRNA (cytidine(1402)-2'-O)-methyltransferase n=1 Tax=Tistlia consotensis TaxID=1321365 RepID=UPI002AC337B7|nr:16S rRNA (cytidine(1402)-2'-O)-methyltransferase [Tistlia consotensis]
MADVGRRALAVLRGADLVACEDTRVTRKLLVAHGIDRPLLSYHDHNAERVRPKLIEAMKAGKTVALITDAGSPLVSDPGYKLVRAALDAGLEPTVVPGPSAPLAALAVAGLPSDRFLFAGFLPTKTKARRDNLAELAAVPATLIFFESAKRLAASLADMAAVLGAERPAAVTRELTKRFEEVRRDSLGRLAAHYAEAGPPKGEVTLVIGPPAAPAPPAEDELDARLREALAGASLRDAVAAVAAATGLPRRQVYERALALSAAHSDETGEGR